MNKIICVISRKGGVGKTATAHNLSAGLAKRGGKVLLIDLDSQCNLSFTCKADATKPGSFEVLNGSARASEAIQKTSEGFIMAGSEELAAADTFLNGKRKEYALKDALEEVKQQFDYIIIDTPAALGALTVNALTASDGLIIPVQADIYSLQGLAQIAEAVQAVKKYCNKALKIKGILLTRYNGRAIISKDMLANFAEAAKQMQTKLYNTPIREAIAVKEAQAQNVNIFDYAPKSKAAADYNNFIEEFLKD